MLKEVLNVRQIPGESRRRWFSGQNMDLTVWFDNSGGIIGFELCYEKGKNEHAVRWKQGDEILNWKVDDGENRPGRYKETPVLLSDGLFEAKKIPRLFLKASRGIDRFIVKFVYRILQQQTRRRST